MGNKWQIVSAIASIVGFIATAIASKADSKMMSDTVAKEVEKAMKERGL